MRAAGLAIEALPAGAGRVPCSWFVDLPCGDRAVVMLAGYFERYNLNHRAGACDRCMRLAVERASEVNR